MFLFQKFEQKKKEESIYQEPGEHSKTKLERKGFRIELPKFKIDPRAHNEKGDAARNQGHYRKAIRQYEKAYEGYKKKGDPVFLEISLKIFDTYGDAIERAPNSRERAWAYGARAQKKLAMIPDVEAFGEKTSTLNPDKLRQEAKDDLIYQAAAKRKPGTKETMKTYEDAMATDHEWSEKQKGSYVDSIFNRGEYKEMLNVLEIPDRQYAEAKKIIEYYEKTGEKDTLQLAIAKLRLAEIAYERAGDQDKLKKTRDLLQKALSYSH